MPLIPISPWGPVHATIKDAVVIGDIAHGEIYGDTRGRWPDGTAIHTSQIMETHVSAVPELTFVRTRNSLYALAMHKPEERIVNHVEARAVVGPVMVEVARDSSGHPLICTGCRSVETLESIHRRAPLARSCCPERKMVPAMPEEPAPRKLTIEQATRGLMLVLDDARGATYAPEGRDALLTLKRRLDRSVQLKGHRPPTPDVHPVLEELEELDQRLSTGWDVSRRWSVAVSLWAHDVQHADDSNKHATFQTSGKVDEYLARAAAALLTVEPLTRFWDETHGGLK